MAKLTPETLLAFEKMLTKLDKKIPGIVTNQHMTQEHAEFSLGKMEDGFILFPDLDAMLEGVDTYFPEGKTDPFYIIVKKEYKGGPVLWYDRWFKASMFTGPSFGNALLEAQYKQDTKEAEDFQKFADKAVLLFIKKTKTFLMIEDSDAGVSIDNQVYVEFGYDDDLITHTEKLI